MKESALIRLQAIPLFLLFALAFCGCGEKVSDGDFEIRRVMHNAEQGWNSGNLESYMNCYLKSDDLRFAGEDRISFGWHSVLRNYTSAYPDKAAMGHLEFYDLDITMISEAAALVVGRWRLDRETDQPHGVFTLIMRKETEGWRIIHDHTGSSDGTLTAAEASITQADLLNHVSNLTNPEMAGRLPGTNGYTLAAESSARHFESLGLQPGGDQGFFQKLTIEANEIKGRPSFQKVGSKILTSQDPTEFPPNPNNIITVPRKMAKVQVEPKKARAKRRNRGMACSLIRADSFI